MTDHDSVATLANQASEELNLFRMTIKSHEHLVRLENGWQGFVPIKWNRPGYPTSIKIWKLFRSRMLEYGVEVSNDEADKPGWKIVDRSLFHAALVAETGYIARFGSSSWELDAIEPAALAEIVRNAIRPLIDQKLWKASGAKQQKMRNELKTFADQYKLKHT